MPSSLPNTPPEGQNTTLREPPSSRVALLNTANHGPASTTTSCLVHHDTEFWPYGDPIYSVNPSLATAGHLSHETDLLKLGSCFDEASSEPVVGNSQELDLVGQESSAASAQGTAAPRRSLSVILGKDTADILDKMIESAHADNSTSPNNTIA